MTAGTFYQPIDGVNDRPAPEHLGELGRRWWDALTQPRYHVDDAASMIVLTICDAFDRREEARAEIRRDGLTSKDRFGQRKAHPGLAIERDQTLIIQRGFRLLGFDQVPKMTEQGSLAI